MGQLVSEFAQQTRTAFGAPPPGIKARVANEFQKLGIDIGRIAALPGTQPPSLDIVKTVLVRLEGYFEGLAEQAAAPPPAVHHEVPRTQVPYQMNAPTDPRSYQQPPQMNYSAPVNPQRNDQYVGPRSAPATSSYADPPAVSRTSYSAPDPRADPRAYARADPRTYTNSTYTRSEPRADPRIDTRQPARQKKPAAAGGSRKATAARPIDTPLLRLIKQYKGYCREGDSRVNSGTGFPTPTLPIGCTLSWGGMREINVIQWNLFNPLYVGEDMGLISALNIPNEILSEKCTVREVLIMKIIKLLSKHHQVICLQDCTEDLLYELDTELGEKWDAYDTHAPPNRDRKHEYKHFGAILYNTDELVSLGGQDDTVSGYYSGLSFIQYHLFEINTGMCRKEKFNIVNTELPTVSKTDLKRVHNKFYDYTMNKARLAWYKTKQPAPVLVSGDLSLHPPSAKARLQKHPAKYATGIHKGETVFNNMYFIPKDGMGANAVGMDMMEAEDILHGLSVFVPKKK